MSHIGIGGGHGETVQNAGHVGIAVVGIVIELQHAAVVLVLAGLVEDAQNHVETVVDLTVKAGDLHDDAVVC